MTGAVRLSHAAATATVALLLAGTVALWSQLHSAAHANIRRDVELEAYRLATFVQHEIDDRVLDLVRMARRWEAARPNRAAWERDAALVVEHDDYQAIEWVDASLHVRWITPFAGNEAAQDLDLTFEPRRKAAMEAARERRIATISRSIDLVQGEAGFLVAVPLFVDGNFDGVILGVFRTQALLDTIVIPQSPAGHQLRVRDGDLEIYLSAQPQEPLAEVAAATDLNLRGVVWTFTLVPPRRLVTTAHSLPTLALVAGLVATCLVAAALYLADAARRRAGQAEVARVALEDEVAVRRRAEALLERAREGLEIQVDERTARLRSTNEQLEAEVRERQTAQQSSSLLVRELDHRVKNTLATVLAVADQTITSSGTLADFAGAFRGRLVAMGQIHRALSQMSWQGLPLSRLLELTVAPYATSADCLSISVPTVRLSPHVARVLGMALHEMATNAAKYGSLSVSSGHTAVTAEVRTSQDPVQLHLHWRETGGPPVAWPQKIGLGTAFIREALAYELDARVELDYRVDGVYWELVVPLTEDS